MRAQGRGESAMILVTGGTGYIGSHTCVELAKAGHELLILDNLSNSRAEVIDQLQSLIGIRPDFVEGDIRDVELLNGLFADHQITAVLHFAGLKALDESIAKPLEYYDNNVQGTLQLLGAMRQAKVRTLVFSSSAAVYGDPARLPISEDSPRACTNPYGKGKAIIEEVLTDLHLAEPEWRVARLRYFNPVGAHGSGLIGEDPRGIPTNLMPIMAQVALGERRSLDIWGNDYPTADGTGVRDYIHVVDLAEGHVAALDYCNAHPSADITVNLGTGQGYSVFEMVSTFEQVTGRPIRYEVASRRGGDIAQCWADPRLARQLLGWTATRGLAQMCADAWRWQLRSKSRIDTIAKD